MNQNDYTFPCAGCICNHCANNVETEDKCTGEAKITCFFCDECRWFDNDLRYKDMRREQCEEYIVTNAYAEQRRKRIGMVKMKKDRLTERDKYGHAYFPECFKTPCWGSGCAKEKCEFMTKVCEKLAKYEETEEQM